MALFRHGTYDHLHLVNLLGLMGAAYAVLASAWQDAADLIVLAAVLFIIEFFPIKLGRVGFTFSFPVLFAMAMVTGYEATAVLSLLVITAVHVCRRKPVRTLLFNASVRCMALLAAGWAVHAQPFFFRFQPVCPISPHEPCDRRHPVHHCFQPARALLHPPPLPREKICGGRPASIRPKCAGERDL
ncbi:hypothetical protein [Effusibacillus pohliae]|uniref:hypothetical protein n=1 Tax=Effusibacillus pohliae TaxID=232270 RepID=UPI000477F2DC|nr:hypothetical protein [Effusibacillus pohliae]